ncbi:MAG: mannose-1-phosphate guanylyltransferase [Flavobacteriales bacterium]|nr:mannose-1-phosphate guanylyltransferase [Flavobacteriales bacterium]
MSEKFAVIMAGGIGSRFWPVSRTDNPKQFLDILGTGKTLIQMTFDRLVPLFDKEKILIVTNKEYLDLVQKQLPEIPSGNILLEPSMRNTAPCIAYSVYKIRSKFPNASLTILPSDHLISNEAEFLRKISEALEFSGEQDTIVTLGIKPSRPDTGYGYIQYLSEKEEKKIYKVKTFTEKPTLEVAENFIRSGDFLWNAGIFVANVKTWVNAYLKFLPEIHELFDAGSKFYNTKQEEDYIERSYSLCTVISIDYGIIEKAENVYVIPSSFGWSDLGTWRSVKEISGSNEQNNVLIGENVIDRETQNCMVYNSDKGIIVLQGVENLLVVKSEDALLICDIDMEQEVRVIVKDIKEKYNGKYN